MGNNVTVIPKKPARQSLLTSTENIVYMPLASKNSHGIVRVGDGLNITPDGLLSVDVNGEWYATIRGDVDQLKVSVQDLKTDVDTALTDVSDINEKLSDIENGTKLISVYQTKQDSGLVTINKTVVGGINEIKNQTTLNINNIDSVKNELTGVKRDYATLKYVDDLYANLSMGGNKSYVFETREQFISWLDGVYEREDSFKPELLNIGDMVLIEEIGVPDYWVKSKSSPMTINDFREYETKIEIPEIKLDEISITKNVSGELQAVALKNAFKNIESAISYSDFTGMIRLTSDQYKELVGYGSITVDDEIIDFDEGTLYITPELESYEIQEQLDALGSSINMKADRAVVDQNTVEIVNLQSTVTELTTKVTRSLVTPMNAPSTIELVAVDDGNAQTMIEIGEGLLLENGVLKAIGSTSNAYKTTKLKPLFEGEAHLSASNTSIIMSEALTEGKQYVLKLQMATASSDIEYKSFNAKSVGRTTLMSLSGSLVGVETLALQLWTNSTTMNFTSTSLIARDGTANQTYAYATILGLYELLIE